MNKYLSLLKANYPTKEDVLTELINLEAITQLPKGTEHFISDIHGEYDAFDFVLRTGSGSIREKVKEVFPSFTKKEINALCELIYYPERTILACCDSLTAQQTENWYISNIHFMLQMVKKSGQKYTRSKVRKSFPKKFAYIIEELLTEMAPNEQKQNYFNAILHKITSLNQASALICALSETIQRLVVDHLHVVGDIYDRGPYPDKIMDKLMQHHSVDIQWGNHDIIWMAAMAGSPLAMVNLIRISARYGNIDIIEERYGINLRALIDYANHYYHATPAFDPRVQEMSLSEKTQMNTLQQACAILQFKLEEQLIDRRPEFLLENRRMLSQINYEHQTIDLNGSTYPLIDFHAPTVDPTDPKKITSEEKMLLDKLMRNFQQSEKLKRHTDFLITKGSMYLCYNGNLLYHGCLPVHKNGDFKSFQLGGVFYAGKELLDFYERHIHLAYQQPHIQSDLATDLLWYLWMGENSSLFGKQAMTTFERYYIQDKQTHHEEKSPYYALRNDAQLCHRILQAFGLETSGHIINGHTPVKEVKGESPIKAQGKMLVIDGGYAKAYQKTTGVAGYTLLSNSYGIQIATHTPFTSIEEALRNQTKHLSVKRLVETAVDRKIVQDTTIGQKLLNEIKDLEQLYMTY